MAQIVEVGSVAPRRGRKPVALLVGCGQWSRQAHIPALKSRHDRVDVFLADRMCAAVSRAKDDLNGQATQEFSSIGSPAELVEQYEQRFPGERLEDAIDAVIIATPPVAHFEFCRWALQNRKPTLVDKPLTITTECSTIPEKAREIVTQFEELRGLARDKGVTGQFGLVAQKRYQEAYREIGNRVATTYEETEFPVTAVQLVTNDGYFLFPDEFEDQVFHGYQPWQGGGKLTHTGYHFLDIVSWIMRHAGSSCQMIHHACITAHALRPLDSVLLSPYREPQPLQQTERQLGGYSDVNIYVLIKFADPEGHTRCVFQASMLHEGFSLREDRHWGRTEGRTKTDMLTVWQGPVLLASLRRLARITGMVGEEPGADNHVELQFASRSTTPRHRLEDHSLEKSELWGSDGCRDDRRPTEEFLDRLLDRPNCAPTSPAVCHAVPIRLLAGIYESLAWEYQEGRPRSVEVVFDPREWQQPPIANWS